jgi:hypothetical protein
MAVGTYHKGPDSEQSTLSERLKGTTWSIVPTPAVAGVHYSQLTGLSCPAPTTCVAVGYTATSRTDTVVRALAEQWNGASWTIDSTPLPAGATWASLQGVTCLSAVDCIAVGGFIRNEVTGEEQPLAEQWNGSAWTVLNVPNPKAENGSSFSSVACPTTPSSAAAEKCEVVGDYDYADVAQSVMAYGFTPANDTWAEQKPVNPLGQESNAGNAVSCASTTVCMAVGSWNNTETERLAQEWNGNAWAHQKLPHPTRSVTSELSGVACAASTACTAVGESGNNQNDNPSSSLVYQWNGLLWAVATVPDPHGASSLLAAVSCTSTSDCVAVGSSHGTGPGATLVEVSSS